MRTEYERTQQNPESPQGFRDSYIIDEPGLTKTAQVKMCGNSVCPPLAEAVVSANFPETAAKVAA
jgi:site-specific DNA-cytosine methylase